MGIENKNYPLPMVRKLNFTLSPGGEGKSEGEREAPIKRNNIEKCRKLRKEATDAERKLWELLRNRQLNGVKFRRQFPVCGFILDFYCPEYKLGVEADGGHHYENNFRERDELRTKILLKKGIEIIRFNDREILTNIEGVYEVIQRAIEKKRNNIPSPLPSPHWGEERSNKFSSTGRGRK